MSRASASKGFGQKKKRRIAKRRIATLALAIAVPAVASPQSWSFPAPLAAFGSNSTSSDFAAPITPMGFETPGMSFPGSAFYYISDLPELADIAADPALSDELAIDLALLENPADPLSAPEQASLSARMKAGPAARALQVLSGMGDLSRARQCMTLAIYYEAASESDAGQRAVAQVVLNRVAHPTYPSTVCGVVFQGSERRTGCQFSFTCDGSLSRRASTMFWGRAARVARGALAGSVFAPVGLSTHYHTIAINPYWASSLNHVTTIGAHRFYKWRGSAGKPSAFSFRYRGGEPLPVRHTPLRTPTTRSPLDPVQLGQNYSPLPAGPIAGAIAEPSARQIGLEDRHEVSVGTVGTAMRPQTETQTQIAPPISTIMPDSGNVNEAYANSGQWIVQP